MEEGPKPTKLIGGMVVGILVLGGVIYGGYVYSQKYGAKMTLPSGQTYVGENKGGQAQDNPPTAPTRFTADASVAWKELKGKIYGYSFSYPETLNLGVFNNDLTDAVAIQWGNIPAQNNILLNIESIEGRSIEYVGKQEEFVRNWWRYFSGLSGVKSVEKFTNTGGLKGYRAYYINKAGQSPNTDIFFEIPGDNKRMIHIANGVLEPALFDRLIDSVKYTAPKPTSTEPTQ